MVMAIWYRYRFSLTWLHLWLIWWWRSLQWRAEAAAMQQLRLHVDRKFSAGRKAGYGYRWISVDVWSWVYCILYIPLPKESQKRVREGCAPRVGHFSHAFTWTKTQKTQQTHKNKLNSATIYFSSSSSLFRFAIAVWFFFFFWQNRQKPSSN